MREMKDSGIEWIGEIPVEWEHCEIKYYCTDIFPGATPQSTNPDYWDGNINWIPSGSCHDRKITIAPKKITQAGYDSSSTKLVPANTALVAMTGATCGSTGYLTIESCTNQSVTAYIENKEKCNSVFLWYILRAAKEHLLTFQSGGAQGGVNVEVCKNIVVPFVPLKEQIRIADFLDRRCAEIDSIIEKTKQTIEEYKTLKQSITTEAVTKGVRGARPMKDSGIEWIGEIPAEWSIKKLKFISRFRQEKYTDSLGSLSYIGLENIISWNAQFVETGSEYDITQSLVCEAEDILFGKLRPYLAKVYYVPQKLCCSSEFCVINVEKGFKNYYKYIFLSHGFVFTIDRSTYGTKMPRANSDFIKNMDIPIPDIAEQQEIADYLDRKCAEIDKLIEAKTKLLEELETYKKSVIYEYVTGKKEVTVQ